MIVFPYINAYLILDPFQIRILQHERYERDAYSLFYPLLGLSLERKERQAIFIPYFLALVDLSSYDIQAQKFPSPPS